MSPEEGKGIEAWEDPPERPQRYEWETIAKQLRRRPHKWAKIFDRDRTSLAVALRSGHIRALKPSKGFEFRTSNGTRGTPRTCTLHARYVPENDVEKEGN